MQLIRRPYEILIRWKPSGEISGAHVGYLTVAADDLGHPMLNADGSHVLLKSEQVQPIDQAGPEMGQLLGEVAVQAQAEVASLSLDKVALQEQVKALQSQVKGLTRAGQKLIAQLDAAKAKRGAQQESPALDGAAAAPGGEDEGKTPPTPDLTQEP